MKWSKVPESQIVRYFGGTLLGTGGLVKAYGDSAKEVLKIVPTEELIEKSEYRMILPYNAYTLIKRLLESVEATIDEEKFDTMIEISGKLPSSNASKMKEGTDDIGQGRIALDINT